MLYGEIIAVCSDIHTKHIHNTILDLELLNVKPVVVYIFKASNTKPIRSSHYNA
jgi:hypothetical protein